MNLSKSDQPSALPHPRWATNVLLAAGIYNILWGVWVVLRPNDLFDWTGIDRPIYPGIWQCVGMIVGVYGVGYAIASKDPIRHWPIVLVGFLGKLFGPIGMAYNFIVIPEDTPGRLPAGWAMVNVTNDLVWWIPFAAILYLAFKDWNQPKTNPQLTVQEANHQFLSQHGVTVADLSRDAGALVVFLRHSGCTFCRESLCDISNQRDQIEANGINIVLVHMGDNASSEPFFQDHQLGEAHRISDPQCDLYRAYQLPRGQFSQLFGATVFWRGFQAAILKRHGIGKLEGDGFQMPGVFLIRDNQIVAEFRHKNAGSRPYYCSIADSAIRSDSLTKDRGDGTAS